MEIFTTRLGIVGITDQYIFEKIDSLRYVDSIEYMTGEVKRFNIESDNSERREEFIQYEEEFRFMLFRHWSLYDSMYHSSYIASKLGIWKERGRKRLQNLLAKIG